MLSHKDPEPSSARRPPRLPPGCCVQGAAVGWRRICALQGTLQPPAQIASLHLAAHSHLERTTLWQQLEALYTQN